jgi:hypothetical protein
MDKLSAEQQAEVKKTSTERLRSLLVKTGLDEDGVYMKDRPALLDAWTQHLLIGEAVVATANANPLSAWERELQLKKEELALRRKEREFQLKMREAEEKRRTEEREAEDRRRAADHELQLTLWHEKRKLRECND